MRAQGSGSDVAGDARRNSSSCPMLWPLAYASRIDQIKEKAGDRAADLLEELALVTRLTGRVADLFTQTGLEISSHYIEPLQLVRYDPTELFSPHCDYHETPESSVQGEQRAFTVLFFGATLPSDAGGETHFPELNVSVSPRKGDALVWANVDSDGDPEPRSLHEGRAPADGYTKIAVNCWVADRPFDLGSTMDKAVRMGD